MASVSMILLVAALVIFLLGAFSWPHVKLNLVSLGLACWVASQLLGGLAT